MAKKDYLIIRPQIIDVEFPKNKALGCLVAIACLPIGWLLTK